MEPGPELDRMVAEKVMLSQGNAHWSPSTDIAQAWQVALAVCRRLDSDPYNGWVDVSDDGKAEVNSACAKFWGKGDQLVLEYGRTVPEAICLAALKAVGG